MWTSNSRDIFLPLPSFSRREHRKHHDMSQSRIASVPVQTLPYPNLKLSSENSTSQSLGNPVNPFISQSDRSSGTQTLQNHHQSHLRKGKGWSHLPKWCQAHSWGCWLRNRRSRARQHEPSSKGHTLRRNNSFRRCGNHCQYRVFEWLRCDNVCGRWWDCSRSYQWIGKQVRWQYGFEGPRHRNNSSR